MTMVCDRILTFFFFIILVFAWIVPQIIADIEDIVVAEGTAAEFSIKVAPEDAEALWYIDGIQVFESDKFKLVSSGHWRYLVIYDTSEFDSGIITVCVGDEKMEAELSVQGRFEDPISRSPAEYPSLDSLSYLYNSSISNDKPCLRYI